MNRIAQTVIVNIVVGMSIAAQLFALAILKLAQPTGLVLGARVTA